MKREKYVIEKYREERNQFVAKCFRLFFWRKNINIGGRGKDYLKNALIKLNVPFSKYIEIDLEGRPNLKIDLEKELPLPFEGKSFDTVVATDVLEHLENHLDVFREIVRMSKRYIIISLPNPWASLKFQYLKRKGKSGKFYGFPCTKPQDRHKWFFNYMEAEKFLRKMADIHNLKILELFPIGFHSHNLIKESIRFLIGIIFGKEVRHNLFSTAIWCLYEKK